MEDEIGKHSKEILSVSQAKTGSFKEKIGKIFLEVVIIVFSIMVSLWLANWNDKRKERAEAKDFLKDLKEDLVQDTVLIKRCVTQLERYIKEYKFALSLTSPQMDSLKKANVNVYVNFDIIPIQLNVGNYQGFKTSGKIGFIDNKTLKKDILSYYEQLEPNLKEVGKSQLEYQKTLMNTFFNDEFSNRPTKDFLSDPKVKTVINNARYFSELMVDMCNVSVQQADSLILLVNKELK